MKIYMDNCCFNRITDDRSDPVIFFDRNSVLFILEFVEKGVFEMIGSQMLVKEIESTTDSIKKDTLKMIYSLCSSEINVDESIIDRAIEIREQSNIRTNDSIHLACAEYAGVDVLLTVDKKFRNNANRIPAKVKVMDPTMWLLEVLYGHEN